MNKICILGGLGHIGSGLTQYLTRKYPDMEITVVDNLSTLKNHSLLGIASRIKSFVEIDVRDPQIFNVLQNQDLVLHLAAMTRAYNNFDLKNLSEHNLGSTRSVLKFCEQLKIPIIFVSSSKVFDDHEGDVTETTIVRQPENLYAKTKLEEESIVLSYEKGFVLRLGTIYGISPGMQFHTMMNRFCWNAINSFPIPIWSNSLNSNSPLLYLNHLIRVFEKLFLDTISLKDFRILHCVSENISPLDVFYKIKKVFPDSTYDVLEVPFATRSKSLNMLSSYNYQNEYEGDSIPNYLENVKDLYTSDHFNWSTFYKSL